MADKNIADKNIKVTIMPLGIEVKATRGEKLINIAYGQGLDVNALCGGKGTCGKCRARVVEGGISEYTENEKKLLSEEEMQQGIILLCQQEATGDLTIELDGLSNGQKEFVPDKGAYAENITGNNPIVAKTFHQLTFPTVNDQISDLNRIIGDVPGKVALDLRLLSRVPVILRDGEYRVTSAIFNDTIIALEAGNTTSQLYGIAFDIGTTSVAGYLVDLHSCKVLKTAFAANKQRVHGADVISRINYTIENPNGLSEMKELVINTLDEIISKLLAGSGIPPEHIYIITLVGNTVMSHLLLGVNPLGIAFSPFVPVFAESITAAVDFLGLKTLLPAARFILLPNIAGYVGSDTVGVMLATKIYELSGNWLAVDIGTNGEVVLAAENRLLTCSTAAGPAFEGASISQGMRAEPGAIYKVAINDDVDIAVVGDQEPRGICGSGLVDAVSELVRLGVVRKNGRINSPKDCPMELPEKVRNRIKTRGNGLNTFVLVEGKNEVAITQKDISELQLAKGAIRAGVEILLDEAGIAELDGILLAGAFGSHLRPESLKGIGMLPDIDVTRIRPVGNAAGSGAIMALQSKEQLQIACDLPKRTEHIELSLHKKFQRQFVRGMSF